VRRLSWDAVPDRAFNDWVALSNNRTSNVDVESTSTVHPDSPTHTRAFGPAFLIPRIVTGIEILPRKKIHVTRWV